MTLNEKIRKMRKDRGLKIRDLEKRLIEIFGKNALRYNTLYRIEKGLRQARVSSLSQICIGLGVSLKELKEGTEEEKFSLVDLFKKGEKFAQYVYSEKAYAHILTRERQPFLALRLFLEPDGQTKLEQDPLELGNYQKWVYGLKGKITCVVGNEKFLLRKNEAFCFNSNVAHSFQNNTAQKATCLIIQNPKHI
jgi:transcriptional regulator with XRE-family HTH domain